MADCGSCGHAFPHHASWCRDADPTKAIGVEAQPPRIPTRMEKWLEGFQDHMLGALDHIQQIEVSTSDPTIRAQLEEVKDRLMTAKSRAEIMTEDG